MSTIRTVKMTQVHRNPNQPREFFDEAKLQELATAIKTYGQMTPIEVRPMDEGGYQIVSGERRWRAHQLLNKATIKVSIISEKNDLKAFKRSVSENVNREDMTPFEEANAYQRILDEEDGATEKSVAADFGKTTAYVRLRLQLLNLRHEFQQIVSEGKIGTQAAVQIAQLSLANQGAMLAKFTRGEFESDNAIVHFAYAMKQQQNQAVLMITEELTPEQKEKRAAAKRKTKTTLDRIEQIRVLLDEIGATSELKLAEALEGEVGKRLEQLDRVAESLTKARFQLKQAKAHAEAKEILVNPEAEAEEHSQQAEPVAA
ncbi:ParB/RepB/Spo0J family partition protein [Streptomyces sp. PCS3-D2]|uniref:ParB/RepB/Spo0J family partition protein n=1 Tax=Streptomyces sp. PCS3-D2 TaxID=1460244 RepID=UPI00044EC746|nr:ParB/RepB/Spo0J family partition protein [Streptomyces sp. PCS3-D2]WKV74196.1 ParB/RepB/Spo0J family partition protein [Streptomyces sp. PCS3-D2]